jgi:phosphopantothenoylcysteine decarboxylase/phosphopantothenate--cysteine ligase
MFDHPATRENLAKLMERGAYVAGPAEGHLASGLSGKGRLLELEELIGHIRLALGRKGRLTAKKILITAGGTQEPLDPVRVLTNKSSGKQGYALAQAALDAGAEVTLISAPTSLTPPVGTRLVPVQTAKQMLEAVLAESVNADALIMAAAVADFRPKQIAGNKMKKREGIPQIELEATEDILEAAARAGSGRKRPRLLVGFAAESRDLLGNAAEKLKSKGLDFLAANDISAKDAGFGTDTNRVVLLFANGKQESLPLMSKAEVAEVIIQRIAELLE